MKQTKVIKRYANRKLYDTERSCYVTLDEIAQMIKEGDDVKVVDNKSKDDLTAVTLAQIIVEEEKKDQRMPLKLLRTIIQSSSELTDWKGALGDFYTDRLADPVKRIREDVERRVDSLIRRDGREGAAAPDAAAAGSGSSSSASQASASQASGPEAAAPAHGAPEGSSPGAQASSDAREDVKSGVVKEFVHHTTEAFETWQKRIDERVRDTVGKMARTPRPDIEALRTRVEALEARLREVEARKRS